MTEVFTSIPSPFNMVVAIVLIATCGSVIGVLASELRKFATHRQEMEFKRDLIERGMSVEEVERLVASTKTDVKTDLDEL